MGLRKWQFLAPEEIPPMVMPMGMAILTILVHHPDQTKRCRAIKVGMSRPMGYWLLKLCVKFSKIHFYPENMFLFFVLWDLENPPKNIFFVFWGLEDFYPLDKTLVHQPDQTKKCRAIKIGMCPPIGTSYGGFLWNFWKSIFTTKIAVFRILGLRIFL